MPFRAPRASTPVRGHRVVVCRDLVADGVPITPRILERALACMMLDISHNERVKPLLRTPAAAKAAAAPGGVDPALAVIAGLDGRYDPRAYRYIEDTAAAGRLPVMTMAAGGRTIDLRGTPPATAEAFVLQFFHAAFRTLRGGAAGATATAGGGKAAAAPGSVALLVPPFRVGLVNKPSGCSERGAATAAARALASAPPPEGGVSLDDDLTDLSMGFTGMKGKAVRPCHCDCIFEFYAVRLAGCTIGDVQRTRAENTPLAKSKG